MGIAKLIGRLAITANASANAEKGFLGDCLGCQVDDTAAKFAGKVRRIGFLNKRRSDETGGKKVKRHNAAQRFRAWQG